jgi:phospholipid N-methyltransferase
MPKLEAPAEPVEVGWLWNTKASRTKEQLAEFKARPKRALGQNFVTDENILQRIVEESGIEQGDLVLEIGPGTGNLTVCLLKVRTLPRRAPYKHCSF